MNKSDDFIKGMKWRLAVTIYGSIGTLVFVIALLAFYPNNFSLWQDLAIVLISLLVLGAIMAGIWIPWKVDKFEDFKRWGKKMEQWGKESSTKSKRSR